MKKTGSGFSGTTLLSFLLGMVCLVFISGCEQEGAKTSQTEEPKATIDKLLSVSPAEEMKTAGVDSEDVRLAQIEARERALSALQDSLASREIELNRLRAQLDDKLKISLLTDDEAREFQKRLAESDRLLALNGGAKEDCVLLPQATAGECFAKVVVPPQYKTVTDRVLKRQAAERIEVIPAKYEKVQEKTLVAGEVQKLEVIPATFGFEEETLMVKPAVKKLTEIPARYETVTEKVLVSAARTEWRKGHGPVQKIDQATGEIMCLVEVPAQYKTVSKQVLQSPATTQEVEVPAVYKTIKKRVMKTPPTTRTVTIPAQYKTIEVTRMVSPPTEKRVVIPEEWQTVSKKELVSAGRIEWRSILCETNITRDRIGDLQRALVKAGYDPGPVDGLIGSQTMEAVNAFQKANGLPVDQYLNVATVKALGVSPR